MGDTPGHSPLSEGTIDVPGCAELRLDLDALWAEVDRLGPEEEADH